MDSSEPSIVAAACGAFVASNSAAVLVDAVKVLATLLSNVAKNPAEIRFRKINLQNAKIRAAVVSAEHATDVLIAAGFSEDEGGAALTHKAEDAGAQCAAALKALDDACATCENAPFTLRLALPHGGAGVRCCTYAGDGKTVLTGAMDNVVRVFPSTPPLQGEAVPCAVLAAHESARGASGVFVLRALPGGEVASAGRDGKVCVWDATDATGQGSPQPAPLAVLVGHGDARGKEVTNKQVVVALAHDGALTLLSGGWDNTARAWPPRTAGAPGGAADTPGSDAVLTHAQAVLALSFLSDGRLVTGAGDGAMTLWARADAAAPFKADGACRVSTPVRGLAPLPGGGFGQVGNDGVLRTFTRAPELAHSSPACGCYLFAVASLSPATRQLATGGDDGVVRIWTELASGLQCVQMVRTPGDVYALSVLPDGALLCASDEAGAYLFTRRPGDAATPAAQKELAAAAAAFAAPQAASAPAPPQAAGGGGGGGGQMVNGVQYDYVFPVEMGRGTSQIYWNRGDDLEAVAAQFALRNGVGTDELGDIKAFILTAMGQAGGGGGGGAAPAGGGPAGGDGGVPPGQQSEMLAQVVSMGFDAAQAKAALERTGWSVEAALGVLLG